MTYKIAIVGLGKIARDQHVPCIKKNKKFSLVATVSRNAKLDGIPAFRTIAELAASPVKPDAVALCTPPSVRLALAAECAAAGYHLLVEKPPTPTLSEAQELIRLAARKNRVAYFTWHSRDNRAVDEAKKLLKGKRIAHLAVDWKEDVNRWHPGQDWISQPGGFGVCDPGINALSIVTKILPEPIYVVSAETDIPVNWSTPIGVRVRFRHSDDRSADLSAVFDWRQRGKQTWTVDVTTHNGMKLRLENGGSVLFVDDKLVLEAPMREYEAIYARFARLLAQRKSDTDIQPLQLIADIAMLAKPIVVDAFAWDA
jgi:D-galactose 1-dehydrogenase